MPRAEFLRSRQGRSLPRHKLPLRPYLAAIAIFCNEVKGKSALALSRDLGVSYKCAFVLLHKLREAMAEEMKGRVVGGEGKTAEVDGGYFGGYAPPANLKREYRRDRRYAENQTGKRKVVVVNSRAQWPVAPRRVPNRRLGRSPGSSSAHRQGDRRTMLTKPVHRMGCIIGFRNEAHQSPRGVQPRRCLHELGGGIFQPATACGSRPLITTLPVAYLLRFAQKAAWREDHRRMSNGEQTYRVAGLAMRKRVSPDFTGYWQRHSGA